MPNENDNTRAFINLGGHSGKTIKKHSAWNISKLL